MEESLEKWLERISTGEASLRRMRREIKEAEKSDLTEAEESKAIVGLNRMAENTRNTQEYAPVSEPDEDDDFDLTEEQEREITESIEEHSEFVLTEHGVPILRKAKIEERGKVSGKIKESRITEPVREGTYKVRDIRDGMTMVGPGVWLPEKLAESGSGDEILEYMQEHRIGIA